MRPLYRHLAFVLCSLCCPSPPHSTSRCLSVQEKKWGEKWTPGCYGVIILSRRLTPLRLTAANGTDKEPPIPPAPPQLLTFFFVLLSFPLRRKGYVALPLTETPAHCKRMSLSHGKQSAFIMPYQRGPPSRSSGSRDTPAARMCLGPVASWGSRSTNLGNGAQT